MYLLSVQDLLVYSVLWNICKIKRPDRPNYFHTKLSNYHLLLLKNGAKVVVFSNMYNIWLLYFILKNITCCLLVVYILLNKFNHVSNCYFLLCKCLF